LLLDYSILKPLEGKASANDCTKVSASLLSD